LIQPLQSQTDELQFPENHILLGYGFINVQEIGESFSSGLSFGLRTLNHQSSFGPLYIAYENDISIRLSLGVTSAWFTDNILVTENDLNSSQDDSYVIDRRYLIIMATACVNYHHSRDLRVYSRIVAGINAHRKVIGDVQEDPSKELTNLRDFTWQFDVIGINIGHDISVFAELSLNMIAMFKFGIIFNF
jgi:hypothetical protein